MQKTVNWEELGIEANQDRRREVRIPLAIAIEVTGFDVEGKFFCQMTKTIDISECGCSFPLERSLQRGGVVAIKVRMKECNDTSAPHPFLYQVARATADGDHWIIGTAKLQPESVWLVAFPKPQGSPRTQ